MSVVAQPCGDEHSKHELNACFENVALVSDTGTGFVCVSVKGATSYNSNVLGLFCLCFLWRVLLLIRLHRSYNWARCPPMMSCTHLPPPDNYKSKSKQNNLKLGREVSPQCHWRHKKWDIICQCFVYHCKFDMPKIDWCFILCLIVTALTHRRNVFQIRLL